MLRGIVCLAWVVAVSCGALAGAREPQKPIKVGDSEVILGPAFDAKELFSVSGVKCYMATMKDNGAPCTVFSGYLVPHFDATDVAVEITVTLFNLSGHARTPRLWDLGSFSATVQRPPKDRPTRFTALGPDSSRRVDNPKPIFDNLPIQGGCAIAYKVVPAAKFEPGK